MHVEIHHLAGVCSDLQKTITFYHQVLGLKCVQKASLLDGPGVCHFYWDEHLKNFITFYHCPRLPKHKAGINGSGTISFSASRKGLNYWRKRLKYYGIHFQMTTDRGNNCQAFSFFDPDGLRLKMVFTSSDLRVGVGIGSVDKNYCIKGIYGIEISTLKEPDFTALLTGQFKMSVKQQSTSDYRFYNEAKPGSIIDINVVLTEELILNGYGKIHHIALRVDDWIHFVHLKHQLEEQSERTIFTWRPNHYCALYFWHGHNTLFELIGRSPVSHKKKLVFNFSGQLLDKRKRESLSPAGSRILVLKV